MSSDFGADTLRQLAQAAAASLASHGYLDAGTQRLVKDWQGMHGAPLKADGVYGPQSAKAMASDIAPSPAPVAFTPNPNNVHVAVATVVAALKQAAKEKGYTLSDPLAALMVAQLRSEGAIPGIGGTLGGTNNMGAAQVPGGKVGQAFAAAHKLMSGAGAYAHRDSDPNTGAFLGWYWIMPSPLEASRTWIGGNWWGPALLKANPSNATSYATILYRGRYFGGTHAGDPNHNGTINGQPDSNAQEAYNANIADYARGISGRMPSAVEMSGAADDPAKVTLNPAQFASLDARKITPDLFAKAKGQAWAFLLPDTWEELQASNGVVWFGPAPAIVRDIMGIQHKMGFWKRVAFVLGLGLVGVGVVMGAMGSQK